MLRLIVWILLILVFVSSAFVGAVDINPSLIFDTKTLDNQLFFDLRLPRVIFAFGAGVILSLSGLLFQTLFRNALMTPYTLGISSGAVLGAGIAIKLGLSALLFGISAVSIFGFLGALFTVFLLLFLSQFLRAGQQQSLLLLGIALSLFYSSALMIVFYMGSAVQNDTLIRFTMGSLSIIGWEHPLILTLIAFALFSVMIMKRFELQLLSVSEEQAKLKGVSTKSVTLLLLIVSSLAIGTLVSIAGPIGFIGLISPHIVSKFYPVSVANRITKTALFGGFFLVVCDTLTRAINTQSELPIGIVTAAIGAPFFIYLIISRSTK